MLTPRQYESRRNELIALLDEAVALDVPEKFAAELKATAKKCKENQFEIVLVGEFQGGKSSTFDALCDGRDISPRGQGLKTSAAVITVQNISDDETKDGLSEWAEVTFKSQHDVTLGLFDCLKDALIADKTFRGLIDKSDEQFLREMTTDGGFAGIVDLGNPKHCACIRQILHEKWILWNRDRSKLTEEELDLLRIATLQMRYFGTPEYQELSMRTILPILDFQKLVVFPKDWSYRWQTGEDASFTLEECAFVFIKTVLVRLHSKSLERLGCRITDCPGLFANAYDTAVAKLSITNADGVWYLINGEKAIGDQDLKILRAIHGMGMLGKTNATFNLKGPHEQKMREIYPATKSILHNAGIDNELFPYNARLAFLATQGDLLANHPERFSDLDQVGMLRDAEETNPSADPKAMWVELVQAVGWNTNLKKIKDIKCFDEESVATVRNESRFDVILGPIEQSAVSKKSRSILIDKGSVRAAKALVAYEGHLENAEKAAEAKIDEWQQKVKDAKKQLDEFIDKAKTAIDRSTLKSDKDAMVHRLAMDLVESAIGGSFIDDLTELTVAVIREKSKEFYGTQDSFKQAIVSDLNPQVGDLLQNSIVRTVESWKEPSNSPSLSELLRRTQFLCEDIHDLWAERKLDADDIFKGFNPPQVNPEEIFDLCLNITDDLFLRPEMSGMVESLRRGVFTVLYDWTLGLVVDILKHIWKWLFGGLAEDAVSEREGQIRNELERMLNSVDFREKAAEPMIDGFASSLDGIIGKFEDSLVKLSADFKESRCKHPEEMFGKSLEERKWIADENRKIRTKCIQPLRERIEAFEKQVSAELA